MKYPYGIRNTNELAPQAGDDLATLLRKAEGMVQYFRDNAEDLVEAGDKYMEEREQWFVDLGARLRAALADPAQEEDARLDAQATWARELRHSALWVVTSCRHICAPETQVRFAELGATEWAEAFERILEAMRPAAMKFLFTEDLAWLRENGFLRWDE